MADDSSKDQKSLAATTGGKKDRGDVKAQRRGILSRVWNGIFRIQRDDFEKRLQYISKEEASVMARMKKRSQSWRRLARHLIIFSVVLEAFAVGYAVMTTRSVDLNWKMRAVRVLPMFLLPGLSSITYSGLSNFIRMCERKDEKALERLRAERQAKINELKEKTNYYTTQQLIQRYDTDPAAKAAAATVLASKLGAESGLNLLIGDDLKSNVPSGRSNDVELIQSSGLRNRKQMHTRSSSTGNAVLQHYNSNEEMPQNVNVGTTGGSFDATSQQHNQPVVVDHYNPVSTTHDGGWIARIAALLVGEDPTQSYALICGNCHMHNGLARKEDFPYITYYCPHCHALNRSKHMEEHNPGSNSPSTGSLTAVVDPNASNNSSSSVSGSGSPTGGGVVATTLLPEKTEASGILPSNVPVS